MNPDLEIVVAPRKGGRRSVLIDVAWGSAHLGETVLVAKPHLQVWLSTPENRHRFD